jgi:hypothetical protein
MNGRSDITTANAGRQDNDFWSAGYSAPSITDDAISRMTRPWLHSAYRIAIAAASGAAGMAATRTLLDSLAVAR